MAKRRRHRRGGRTTPKGTRPAGRPGNAADRPSRPRPESIPEMLLKEAAHMVTDAADTEEAERWLSPMMVVFETTGIPPVPGQDPSATLRLARRRGDAAAAAFAEGMAVLGPYETRVMARELADELRTKLASEGHELPPWLGQLGRGAVGRAWQMQDVWGDGFQLLVEYTPPDGPTALAGFEVDPLLGGAATGFLVGVALTELQAMIDEDPHTELVEVDPADAATTFDEAMDIRAEYLEPPEGDDDLSIDLEGVVRHRFARLPQDGVSLFEHRHLDDDEEKALIEQFLGEPGAGLLADGRDIAETICNFSRTCDGDPLRWSPARIDAFLAGWIPAKVIADQEWYRNVPPVMRAWLTFAAKERDLPAEALEISLGQVDAAMGLMQENRLDPEARNATTNIVKEMLENGIDLTDEAAVGDWISAYNERPIDDRW